MWQWTCHAEDGIVIHTWLSCETGKQKAIYVPGISDYTEEIFSWHDYQTPINRMDIGRFKIFSKVICCMSPFFTL